jgi:hypothetical protein
MRLTSLASLAMTVESVLRMRRGVDSRIDDGWFIFLMVSSARIRENAQLIFLQAESIAISSSGCDKLAADCCFAPWGAAIRRERVVFVRED